MNIKTRIEILKIFVFEFSMSTSEKKDTIVEEKEEQKINDTKDKNLFDIINNECNN